MLPCVHVSSHRLIDPLHEHSQEEDGGDGRSQIAGDRLDVIKQLTALSRLHNWDPADADGYDAQNPDSKEERREKKEEMVQISLCCRYFCNIFSHAHKRQTYKTVRAIYY